MVKILLLKEAKNKNHKEYINSNLNYSQYDFCFCVNKDNLVTGYRDFEAYIINTTESLSRFDNKRLGLTPKQYNTRLEEVSNNKPFLLHPLTFKPLNTPADVLDKPVRGLRFANDVETSKCGLLIVEELFKNEKIHFKEIFHGSGRLNRIYAYCMEHDLIGSYFSYLNGR